MAVMEEFFQTPGIHNYSKFVKRVERISQNRYHSLLAFREWRDSSWGLYPSMLRDLHLKGTYDYRDLQQVRT